MIETYILQHLQEQAKLKPYLASYDELPAVFLRAAPPAGDPAGDGESRYGQLILHPAIQDDPQRYIVAKWDYIRPRHRIGKQRQR